MTAEEIVNILKEKFGEKVLDVNIEIFDPTVTVEPGAIADMCAFLKDDPATAFDFLSCLSAVDHDDENLRVVYHLCSISKKHKIALDLTVPKTSPKVPTVSQVWQTADWHEREAFDLLGVIFDGHPDLRRILLPEDWEGYPLRKDYVTPQTYLGMPVPYPEED